MALDNKLLTVTPEEVGVPSGAVLGFLDRIAEKKLCLHGFLMLRHGKILAEGYAPPFDAARLHRMYSISKTFVSAAVGLLIGEGRLALSDRVSRFFPEHLPEDPHPFTTSATVRDLLMMATPFNTNTYGDGDRDWVRTFFRARATHAPGTVFSYNTAATVVLNAIVEKLSGQPLLEYMRPRLLDPIGFSPEASCIERPEGGAWGGSGVLCTPRDLAKFALVWMLGGRWEGAELLPGAYVAEATSRQIDNRTAETGSENRFGYGYQIWRTRHNGFAMIGMGGQYALCLPEQDFILVTTADTQLTANGASEILDALWDRLLPRLGDGSLPEDPEKQAELEKASRLSFPKPEGALFSPTAERIGGRTFVLEENPMKIKHLRFDFGGGECLMHYRNATGDHTLRMALGGYAAGTFPETHYYGGRIGVPAGRGYACAASAVWADADTLTATVYITDDYLGTLKMQFSFTEDTVSVLMQKAAEWFLNEYQGFACGRTEKQASL